MKWSSYQEKIFEVAEKTADNIVIKATAGSGKTSTLVELANRLVQGHVKVVSSNGHRPNSQFLAFNKSIATELNKRLPTELPANTLNSFGFRYLREGTGNNNWDLSTWKYANLISAYVWTLKFESKFEAAIMQQQMRQCIDIFRANLTDLNDLDSVYDAAYTYDLDYEPDLHDVYVTILELGKAFASEDYNDPVNCVDFQRREIARRIINNMKYLPRKRQIDFVDQLWLPVELNLVTPDFDVIMTDESQDLNKAQLEVVLRALKPNGRGIFVGDENQAIYLWAGAGSDSIDRIIERTNATVLPLSITYRCPLSHVQLAQQIVPEIEAAPWAEEGILENIQYRDFVNMVRNDYENSEDLLIIGRRNVGLIKTALTLLANRIPAKVKGRDFCNQIVSIIKKIAYGRNGLKRGFSWSDFAIHLRTWYESEWNKLKKQNAKDSKLVTLNDKYESILVLYNSTHAETVDDFIQEIEEMFDGGNGRNLVTLSSIHRAKGLEANTIYIIEPDKLPLTRKGMSDNEIEQEDHVHFVGVTRSKHAMYFVVDDSSTEVFGGMV